VTKKYLCHECGCDEKHYDAIQSVREILKEWAPDISSTTEQSYYDQIIKALDGSQ
jgi:hypothetical protein